MSRRSLNNYQRKYKIIPLRKIEKFLHKYSKIILANSKAVYSELIDEGVKKEKLKLIYNGVILKNKKNFNTINLKKELGLKSSKYFIFIPNTNQYLTQKITNKTIKDSFLFIFFCYISIRIFL